MKKKIVAALLGASLLAGGGAYAAQQVQGGAPRGPMMHADANNDGVITREEVLAGVDARFAKADTNKDGQLSAEERRAAHPGRDGRHRRFGGQDGGERHAKMLERFDADKDGKLSDVERQAAREAFRAQFGERKGGHGDMRAKLLERFDTDKDGKLSDAERQAARQARQAMRGGEGGGGFGGGHRGHGARIHANGDKLISLAESRTAALAMFDRVDANKDGRIDASEREAAHARMKAMRGHHRGGMQAPSPEAPESPDGN
ncbi:MAG: hypothetical protein J7500_09985 [Sphingomonas sp.]|uniref:hypothetical protein n=1 Tax=Sphingomonas sp. TaxID=28214 RepID=UPI001B05E87C|nr:hypothetical protein [Sphingomonas sp.]MBO9623027.1 hypothetical protein [Sphingomonas sp.]